MKYLICFDIITQEMSKKRTKTLIIGFELLFIMNMLPLNGQANQKERKMNKTLL